MQNSNIQLNPSQRKAVEHQGGHLLIIAGPGTGKTHTLTYRIAHLYGMLEDNQKILAITFTNKAANEMYERLQKLATSDQQRVTVATFHQFCLLILRRYVTKTNLPSNFVVASPKEIGTLSARVWPKIKNRDRHLFLEQISQWKSTQFDETEPQEARDYNKKMRSKGWLDFDDLLMETLRLFNDNKDVLCEIQKEYPLVFVDEYQDINRIQRELLKVLIGQKGLITAIGDPNQAIYGFRGSDVRFFESFSQDFLGARILPLSENYRSAQNLLSASRQVVEKSRSIHVPELTAKIYEKGRLTVHEAATDRGEAEYVVHQIERMVGGIGMFSQDSGRVASEEEGAHTFGDIAVLYRLKGQRFALKIAFDRMGIPYKISGESKNSDEALVDDVYFSGHEEAEVSGEKVSLMTLHAAKGLEFPVVFIIGCEKGILPLDLEGLTSEVAEERRLFYVGMTRAKERLYLLRAKRRLLYGKTYTNGASPFLSDIEEELKEYEKMTHKLKKGKKEDTQMSLF